MSLLVEWPMALPSVSNLREHWATRAKRVKAQREATWLGMKRGKTMTLVVRALEPDSAELTPATPLVVTLTRVAPRQLDSHDNLRAAFKAVVDAVAEYLGVDDRDPRIEWRYAQAKGPAAVRIEFQTNVAAVRAGAGAVSAPSSVTWR